MEVEDDRKWKVLIACSSEKDVRPEYYAEDPLFSKKNYSFFNVGNGKIVLNQFDVVNSCDVPGYVRLGRKYAESEVIYNVFKLGLFQDCDYIGLMHYDFNFFDKTSMQTNITELLDSCVASGIDFVSFFSAPFSSILGYYNVLMDERKPNCLFVRDSGLKDPKSINGRIVEDIDKILGKKIDFSTITPDTKIALCCSFMAKREIFDEVGKLVASAIDSKVFDSFDTEDRHRFPGQAIERYVAMYSLLYKKMCFMLDHRFVGGQEDLRRNSNAENY